MNQENIKRTENNEKIRLIIVAVVAFVLGVGFIFACLKLFPLKFVESVTKLEKEVTINETGIADAVEKVYDAVVVVSTYKDQFHFASGTGFVYRTDKNKAYILTNYHVIEKGNEIIVTFTNGNQEKVKIEGGDKYSDIAVLSVDKDKVTSVAEIGKSSDSRLGDTVFTVGAPLDNAYSWTVTRGILSGKDRMVEVSSSFNPMQSDYVMSVLQTDAAINSGNSGGPLSNSNGQVIGITSMKLISSGVEGMGFAIPIETAMKYAEKIVSGQKVTRPYLGITMINVSDIYYIPNSDYYLDIKDTNLKTGVLVTSVEENSAAAKAGLKEKDIIIKMDGKDIKSIAYLRYELYSHEVGDTVKIEIKRGSQPKTIEVKLSTMPGI